MVCGLLLILARMQSLFVRRIGGCSNLLQRKFSGFNALTPRNLADITNKELLGKEPATVVGDIWDTYHKDNKSAHAAIIDDKAFASLKSLGASW